MTDNDDRPLSASERAGWEPAEPPEGFAERVVAGLTTRAEAPAARPRWRRTWLVGVLASATAAAVLLWARADHPSRSGRVQLDARTSIDLSDRAVVVGEAGTDLRWSVDNDGRAHVEQSAGRAFYRVDPGPMFEVVTPHGTVEVTGTCFSVEVNPMSKSNPLLKGILAATFGAAVVVVVYEGGVVLAHGRDAVALAPGQRGVAEADGRLYRVDDDVEGSDESPSAREQVARVEQHAGPRADAATAQLQAHTRQVEQLRADRETREAEIKRLRDEVERLGGNPGKPELAGKQNAARCSKASRTPDCDFVDPDHDTLLEMARCDTVRVDSPGFLFSGTGDVELPADFLENGHLDPGERAALAKTMSSFKQDYVAELRELFVDVGGGTPEAAKDMPTSALSAVIESLLPGEEIENARHLVSQERAGLAEPPGGGGEPSLAERYVRHTVELGNALEAAVGSSLGPERAHELRMLDNGWPGSTTVHSGDCAEQPQ